MEIINATETNFNDLINSKKTLVDFHATWCGPCRMLGPVLEELNNERLDVQIIKVDIDQNMSLAQKYGVMSVPTMMIFENGTVKSTKIGFVSKEELSSWINEN